MSHVECIPLQMYLHELNGISITELADKRAQRYDIA